MDVKIIALMVERIFAHQQTTSLAYAATALMPTVQETMCVLMILQVPINKRSIGLVQMSYTVGVRFLLTQRLTAHKLLYF